GGSDRTEIAGEDQQQQADDHEGDSEGQQEGEEEWRPDHPVDDAPLQRITDHEKGDSVDRQTQKRVDVQAREEVPGDVGADDHQGAMRQVDDVEDAPDETEPEGDGDVYPTQQEAEDDLLGELAHELSLAGRIAGLARAPGRRRILRLAIRDVCREHGVVRAILNLFDDHRLEDVDAAAVELDLPEKRHNLKGGGGHRPLPR